MGVTRRYWGESGLCAVLAGLAVLFGRPTLLVGVGGIGGWLVARQYAFVRSVADLADDIEVTQSADREAIAVEDEVRVTVTAELAEPVPVSVEVRVEPPVGVEIGDGSQRAILSPGERSATAEFEVRCPLAGEFEFDRPTVTATDESGRFRADFSADSELDLTVVPRGLGDLHVGASGEATSAPYGEHATDERGPGFDLAEIRAYVPGDAARQIDWNATARFDEPHVREFETQTERRTAVLLDCRPSMATGPDGGTKFDYARQVALGVVQQARNRGEPVGAYAVGEEGLLWRQSPTASGEGYAALERRLRTLEPQSGAATDAGEATSARETTDAGGHETISPVVARRRERTLRNDDSAFADRLRPFFADADPYVERVTGDPFYGATRSALGRLDGAVTAVVLTDDTNPTETREVVKAARRYDDRVLAFLTPTVLFESDESGDLEAAYERYADFERFRRGLAGVDRVSAFEVGPGDRLDALLAADRARRRNEVSG